MEAYLIGYNNMKKIKENWFKLSIVIICLMVAITVVYNILVLVPQREDESNLVKQQVECSKYAQSFFDYFEPNGKSSRMDEFTNHYNVKLKKCFVLIKTYTQSNLGGDLNMGSGKDLYDAVEKKIYASYSWMSRNGKKYWEVPPLWCDIYKYDSSSVHETCKDEEEFDAYTNELMNN